MSVATIATTPGPPYYAVIFTSLHWMLALMDRKPVAAAPQDVDDEIRHLFADFR